MKIGVLASQGAFAEHINILRKLEADARPVRLPQQLAELDGLVIPGGESTSISKLIREYNLLEEIRRLVQNGLPVFGTCAGMILLGKPDRPDDKLAALELMDMTVKRNAFGRQVDSFETELNVPALGEPPFPAVFIRAPAIEQINGRVEILARLADGTAVAARQDNMLSCAFHPELTDDPRFHRYFLDITTSKG
jgi:5'-phosphate synthase pdxT subunit